MAITNITPFIKVDILVNDVVLETYEDDEDRKDENTVSKYIEAISGADFAIRYRLDKKPDYDMVIEFFLDGKHVAGRYALLKDFLDGSLQGIAYGARAIVAGAWMLSKFAFSDIKTIDSGTVNLGDQLMKDLKGVGQITVNFHYVTNRRPAVPDFPLPTKIVFGEIPEKALKGRALSHQSTLRAPTPTAAITVETCDFVSSAKKPFATFNFKYRSTEALRSLLVIPRSPSPMPLEERDVNTLTPEEMRELLQRQRKRDQACRAVKQEQGVKRERSRERCNTANTANNDDGDISFVSAKRRQLPVIVDEDGTETIDLT